MKYNFSFTPEIIDGELVIIYLLITRQMAVFQLTLLVRLRSLRRWRKMIKRNMSGWLNRKNVGSTYLKDVIKVSYYIPSHSSGINNFNL